MTPCTLNKCQVCFFLQRISNYIYFPDMPLERKTPVAYPDGTYEMIPEQPRGNVLLISNITQQGFSGRASVRRTAFFTFFGKPHFFLFLFC